MEPFVNEALHSYVIDDPHVVLIRHNENATYQVTDGLSGRKYAVRVHESNSDFSLDLFNVEQHSYETLKSEMDILNCLARDTKIPMQAPVANKNGEIVTVLSGGTPVTVLNWVDGKTLDQCAISEDALRWVGRTVGEMHLYFTSAGCSKGYTRYAYDKNMVDRIVLKIDGFYKRNLIVLEKFKIITGALSEIKNRMKVLDTENASYGIVHSDLSKSNLILRNGKITPIDFCLCGYSYFYMDIGSLYAHFGTTDEQSIIKASYEDTTGRRLEYRYIEPFVAMQILLYLATHFEKSASAGMVQRCAR